MDEIKVRNSGYLKLSPYRDERDGILLIMESMKHVPFEIKRVYVISDFETGVSVRGMHAHKELRQVCFCLRGTLHLTLDDGTSRQKLLVKGMSSTGIILDPGLWHHMEAFSPDCILLVLASEYFKESDYIRDYDEFLRWVKDER